MTVHDTSALFASMCLRPYASIRPLHESMTTISKESEAWNGMCLNISLVSNALVVITCDER